MRNPRGATLDRDQQRLLASVGTGMAADALLDRMRDVDPLRGGRSTQRPGCWIDYDRTALRLEDHAELSAAIREARHEEWSRIKPKVLVRVSWAQAAAHGRGLPQSLRNRLEYLQQAARDEALGWAEFSRARGGWPHRRRFASDEEHQLAAGEWNQTYRQHLEAMEEIREDQKAAIERALPLALDEEPADLLELLAEQPPAGPAVNGGALQAVALQHGSSRPALREEPAIVPPTVDGLGR